MTKYQPHNFLLLLPLYLDMLNYRSPTYLYLSMFFTTLQLRHNLSDALLFVHIIYAHSSFPDHLSSIFDYLICSSFLPLTNSHLHRLAFSRFFISNDFHRVVVIMTVMVDIVTIRVGNPNYVIYAII